MQQHKYFSEIVTQKVWQGFGGGELPTGGFPVSSAGTASWLQDGPATVPKQEMMGAPLGEHNQGEGQKPAGEMSDSM